MYQGSLVALVTPMTATGEIDEHRLRDLIEIHIQSGTSAVVILGTTGEASTLSAIEKERVLSTAIEASQRKIPIIAGTGSNSTMQTIIDTQKAMELGADACLVVCPYYVRPSQEGLYQHFKAVAEEVPIPLILYNHPGRTGCDLLPSTLARLLSFKNIIGIKDATGDLARGRELVSICRRKIHLYSGEDANSLAFMLQGGQGVISVTANVAPKAMREMCEAALDGNINAAGKINTSLMPLHKNLFLESNPIPVKWALQQLGWIENGIRLPLTPLAEKFHDDVQAAMKISGVI